MKKILILIFVALFKLQINAGDQILNTSDFLSYNEIDRYNQARNNKEIIGQVKDIVKQQIGKLEKDDKSKPKKSNDLSTAKSPELNVYYKDILLKDLIELLSIVTDLTISIDNELKDQKVTLISKNINLDDLLKHISEDTKPKSFIKKDGKIIKITTTPTSSAATKYLQKVVEINHSPMDKEFEAKVEAAWKNIIGADKNSHILINPETKNIFLRGESQVVDEFTNFLQAMDQPIPRVKIDVMMVLTDANYGLDLGINWSGIYNRLSSIRAQNKNFGFVGIGGALTDYPTPTEPINTQDGNLYVDPLNFAINLFNSAVNTVGNLTSGIVTLPLVFGGPDLNLKRLNLLLNASELESKTKILAKPSVLVTNNQVAKILIGQSLPIYTAVQDVSQGSVRTLNKLTYKDIGISMQVLPTVSLDRKTIALDIFIETSEIISGSNTYNEQGINQNPPVLLILKIKNNVVLENGQTTVIGGLITKRSKETETRVPWLSKLPVVGPLFVAKNNTWDDSEDLIFITPSIVE